MTKDDIIDATRETVDGSGWRLAKDVLTTDYEREESKLVLTLVRGNPNQQEMDFDGKEGGE